MTLQETLTMTALMLAPAFFSLLGMAALGSPAVATLGEITARAKSKVFYEKYGQQTAGMGLVLFILLLLVEAGGIALVYIKFSQHITEALILKSPFTPALAALGAFTLLGIPYLGFWKKMRNAKALRIMLGIGASLAGFALVALAVTAKLTFLLPPEKITPALQGMLPPMAVMYCVQILTAAAGLSCAYLVMRRNKDDFGRDYYNFSLKLAARWSLIPMLGFLACQGWLFAVLPENFKILVMGTPLGIVWAGGAGLGLICAILWLVIARSATPLRLKGLTLLNALLLWLVHTASALLFLNFMSMA